MAKKAYTKCPCDLKSEAGCNIYCDIEVRIDHLKKIMQGYTIGTLIYYPNLEKAQEWFNRQTPEDQEYLLQVRNEDAPALLAKLEKIVEERRQEKNE
jgi:hypothetical protein